MKNIKYILLLSIITLLSSCGGDMQNWPYCDLPDEVANYEAITVELVYNNEMVNGTNGTGIETSKYYSESADMVLEVYSIIEHMHVSPKKAEQTFEKFWEKVSIVFEKGELNYTFEFYELSMTNGYFVFDKKDIYKFKGDFYSVMEATVRDNYSKLTKLY